MSNTTENNHVVYLGLGSNQGDSVALLKQAIRELNNQSDVAVLKCASLYRSSPTDYDDQPDFYNTVIQVETSLSPDQLLAVTQGIQLKMGSTKAFRFGPRLIDIDILLFDDWIIHSKGLEIPHPRMHLRRFVADPLVEIAPHLIHPALNQSFTDIVTALADDDSQYIDRVDWLKSGF